MGPATAKHQAIKTLRQSRHWVLGMTHNPAIEEEPYF